MTARASAVSRVLARAGFVRAGDPSHEPSEVGYLVRQPAPLRTVVRVDHIHLPHADPEGVLVWYARALRAAGYRVRQAQQDGTPYLIVTRPNRPQETP